MFVFKILRNSSIPLLFRINLLGFWVATATAFWSFATDVRAKPTHQSRIATELGQAVPLTCVEMNSVLDQIVRKQHGRFLFDAQLLEFWNSQAESAAGQQLMSELVNGVFSVLDPEHLVFSATTIAAWTQPVSLERIYKDVRGSKNCQTLDAIFQEYLHHLASARRELRKLAATNQFWSRAIDLSRAMHFEDSENPGLVDQRRLWMVDRSERYERLLIAMAYRLRRYWFENLDEALGSGDQPSQDLAQLESLKSTFVGVLEEDMLAGYRNFRDTKWLPQLWLTAMLSRLDPYSNYRAGWLEAKPLAPPGSYLGLGLIHAVKSSQGLMVTSVAEGSSLVGLIQPFERITAANQQSLIELADRDWQRAFFCPYVGYEFQLQIIDLKGQSRSEAAECRYLADPDKSAPLSLIRVARTSPTTNIFIIRIASFEDDFYENFIFEYEHMQKAWGRPQAVLIDLRDHPGGQSHESARFFSFLFNQSLEHRMLLVRDQEPVLITSRTLPAPIYYDGPVFALVNDRTASAGEQIAGEIQAYRRGFILSSYAQTFGKGTVHAGLLSAGLSQAVGRVVYDEMVLTQGYFFRGDGQSPQLIGIQPDLVLGDGEGRALKSRAPQMRDLDNAMPRPQNLPDLTDDLKYLPAEQFMTQLERLRATLKTLPGIATHSDPELSQSLHLIDRFVAQ